MVTDNVQASAKSGCGEIFKTDAQCVSCVEVHWPLIKVAWGANNTFNIVGSVSCNPLPVALSSTDNAVLDTIDSVLDTIKVDTEAIETAVELLDNAVYVDDADWTNSTSSHILVGGLFQSTPQTVTDGDVAPFNITANGALHVSVQGTPAVTISGCCNTVDITAASGTIACGAFASGSIASGAVASGAIASGAIASGAVASGAIASGAYASGSMVATNLNIGAALQTNQIMCGLTSLTPGFDSIDAASSGNNTLLAAVSCKKIRVLSAFMVSAGTVTARFESGADGTALTGQMNLTANSGFVLPFNPVGWFETAACALLNLELSACVSVDGAYTYVSI